jgi:uncharacterized protein (DUF58 family)
VTILTDIIYRPRGRFQAGRAGAHPSSEVGGFGVFRDQVPFLRYPDARRVDIRATLLNPFEETYVRRFEQRQSIDVYAIVDLSASMAFVGAVEKFSIVCDLCESLALSALRIGDRFGLIGCDHGMRDDVLLGATRSRGAAFRAARRLRDARRNGTNAQGFLDAAAKLGMLRKLVLLISDFRWPLSFIEDVFAAFARHDAIPVVISDSAEESPPSWGLLELSDSETGRRRLSVLRPQLREKWIERERERRAAIARLASSWARPPIFIRDAFDAFKFSNRLTAGYGES